jgi:uncharacterized protein YbcI
MIESEAGRQPDTVRPRISRAVVSLLKEFYGRGPVKAKTYYVEDIVLVVLGGGFSPAEATLLAAGQGKAVTDQRTVFQEAMRTRFSEVIEEITGRKVISFMSANDQQADITSQLFILEPRPGDGGAVIDASD